MATTPLKPGVAERTVLTYVKLDFIGNWQYSGSEYAFRPAEEHATLLVVTEAPTGTLVTHFFNVRRRPDPSPTSSIPTDSVIAPKETNIVFIPERCAKVERGDQTQCSGGRN